MIQNPHRRNKAFKIILRIIGVIFLVTVPFLWMTIPHLIDQIYFGKSLDFFNKIISGQELHTVDFYIEIAYKYLANVNIQFNILGVTLIVLSFSSCQKFVAKHASEIIAIVGITYTFFLISIVEVGGILAPSRLGFAFNHYALSLLGGRLDVPAQAIGLEGNFMDDGKVYMYYGILPAILRIPLALLVDLRETQIARLMVFFYCISIGLVCHWLILRLSSQWKLIKAVEYKFWTYLSLFIVWFASPIVILASEVSLTYEPIALAILISVAFFAVIINDTLVNHQHSKNLILLSVLAGLAVHARPHIAIALYLVVVSMSMMTWFIYEKQEQRNNRSLYLINIRQVMRTIPVFVILLVFGSVYLAMNHIKYGSAMIYHGGVYGYSFVESKDSPRIVSARKYRLGLFSMKRVLPNAYFHTFASEYFQSRRHLKKLADKFGAGYIGPMRERAATIVMWAPLYLGMLLFFVRIKQILKASSRYQVAVIFLIIFSCSLMTYFVYAYSKITWRYKVELWPLVFFTSLIYLHWHLTKSYSNNKKYMMTLSKIFILGLAVLSVKYNYENNRINSQENSGRQRSVEEYEIAERCVWESHIGWPDACKYLPGE